MKTKTLRRKSTSITKTRWLAYATAGAATALVGGNSAEAAIHYSGRLDVCFPPHKDKLKLFPLDQAGDYFWFEHVNVRNIAAFSCYGIVSAGFRGSRSGDSCENFVAKLYAGQNISSGFFWHVISCSFGFPYGILSANQNYRSQWTDPGIGYVGFKFNSGAGVQYGWVRVRMSNRPENAFRVLDYAYADPGEPIAAGQKSSNEMVPEESNDIVPQEGSLGWLAVGAGGLLAWRKRRSQAAR